MKFINLPTTLFIGAVLILTSCKNNEGIAPVLPTPEYTLNRTIIYENGAQLAAEYSSAVVQSNAINTTEEFSFYEGVNEPNGNDHISFKITPEKLKGGLIGVYSLKSVQTQATADAGVNYVHNTASNPGSYSASIYNSSFSTFEGNYEITGYDPETKLISGQYIVVLKGAADPYKGGSNPSNAQKCDITVTGSFKNVKIN